MVWVCVWAYWPCSGTDLFFCIEWMDRFVFCCVQMLKINFPVRNLIITKVIHHFLCAWFKNRYCRPTQDFFNNCRLIFSIFKVSKTLFGWGGGNSKCGDSHDMAYVVRGAINNMIGLYCSNSVRFALSQKRINSVSIMLNCS